MRGSSKNKRNLLGSAARQLLLRFGRENQCDSRAERYSKGNINGMYLEGDARTSYYIKHRLKTHYGLFFLAWGFLVFLDLGLVYVIRRTFL